MVLDYFDTSAILARGSIPEHAQVSHFVISELEEIKNSSVKDEHIKARARQATRALASTPYCKTHNMDLSKIEKIRKKHKWLPDNNDGRIIAEAILLKKQTGAQIAFHTADRNMALFAEAESFHVNFIDQKAPSDENLWCGWGKYYPDENTLNSLYGNPQINILEAKINEYCEIYSNSELCDILRWDGQEYKHLDYKPITSAVGQKWKPLNSEQKMLFDLLQNDNVPVKLALGNYGSGKSSLMLSHALDGIQKGKFDKIVFIRNNIEVKDTTPLGALPNGETDKLLPYLMPICDHVGEFTFDEMLSTGVIEACHLGFIRGRDFKNCILFVDEAENLTASQVQLLIGRIGKGSMLFLAGDLRQTDRLSFEKNSGLKKMIERLQDNKLFGMVKLQQSVRSEVCKLADLMD